MRKFITFCGFLIVSLSVVFICAALGDLIKGDDPQKGIIWGLLFFFILTSAGGGYLIKKNIFYDKKEERKKLNQKILEIAKENGGMITVAEVSSESGIDLDAAKAILNDFSEKGFADVKVSDKGSVIYVFNGFLSKEEKNNAKDPLEEAKT
ncbi:MAG TPA: hypothetical protein PLO89_02560 [Spirochaetota bacterium]|nr:hypothetical protein [Spirochaetota bacterium]